MDTPTTKKRILILGGGFGGAYAAVHLEKRMAGDSDIELVLAAKENFLLFTPMLHEVAGSDVEVTDVVQPLRKMLRHTRVLIADVESIDFAKKQVRFFRSDLNRTFDVPYDQLVVAVGSVPNFYHIPGLEEHALTMKTLGDAILVRNRVIDALEVADNQANDIDRRTSLTVVVAGGGFAGVETVGAINDLFRESMNLYHRLTEDMLRIVLVDRGDHILPELGEGLGRYAEQQLRRRGVEIRLNLAVKSYTGNEVTFGDDTKIATRMLIWTAGITPAPFLSSLPCQLQRGRIVADEYLRVPSWPGVWTLGDCAQVPDVLSPGKFCPPTAQHATRQAAVLAANIQAAVRGGHLRPFKFKMLGLLATIGRRTGVAEILGLRFSGIFAWWLWRAIYLSKLPGLQKKARVAIDWILDLIFSKDIVQLPTLRLPMKTEEPSVIGTEKQASALIEPRRGAA